MAQPTNTFDTYDAVGIREDLQDVIYSIAPTETPFMSAAREQVKTLCMSGKQILWLQRLHQTL